MKADLHLHTTASDGALSPSAVVDWAAEKGLEVIAVTDHDTVSGIEEAVQRGREKGIGVVSGIEFSTFSTCEIHILGYNFDYKNPLFGEELARIKDLRRVRNIALGEKLRALGINLDFDFAAPGIGRAHIAKQMVKEGIVPTFNLAFDRYLGKGGLAYSTTERLRPMEAVALIRRFGGFASLAHPKTSIEPSMLSILLDGLKRYGLGGLEVYYPAHSDADISSYLTLARKYALLPTGGSDFHGEEPYKSVAFELVGALARQLGL